MLACYGTPEHASIQLDGAPFRSIFVVRDPRALLVSWYFSTRFSHVSTEGVERHRQAMEGLNEEQALTYMISEFEKEFVPVFEAWLNRIENSVDCKLVRFEDLIGASQKQTWMDIFDHLDILTSPGTLNAVLDTYSIGKLRGNKSNPDKKYAAAGQRPWQDHLVNDARVAFEQSLGKLPARLGYE
ncbi:sulfotransferase domain-containing protein [uncultured Devosia sp.]|uniref:sulfotransferase domain-containing protein n=1 Tax=uncultured Devosia sp. TaxID=211434 RepID=UPI002639832C|nr:sulfotransferase domain-containing protein [uncultured Devosia sp.]